MIYLIQNDGFGYQQLDLMVDDIIDARPSGVAEDNILDFSQTNTPMAFWWPVPETIFINEEGSEDNSSIPDISKWIDASLVLSPKAKRLLGDTLKQWGELLPVKVRGEVFYILTA